MDGSQNPFWQDWSFFRLDFGNFLFRRHIEALPLSYENARPDRGQWTFRRTGPVRKSVGTC